MSGAELATPSVSWSSTKIPSPVVRTIDRLMILMRIDCALEGRARKTVSKLANAWRRALDTVIDLTMYSGKQRNNETGLYHYSIEAAIRVIGNLHYRGLRERLSGRQTATV
jgi:hypothetical protein